MLNFGENTRSGEGIDSIKRPETTGNWQQVVRNAVRDPQILCQELGLDPASLGVDLTVNRDFPLFVPRPCLKVVGADGGEEVWGPGMLWNLMWSL